MLALAVRRAYKRPEPVACVPFHKEYRGDGAMIG